MAEVLLDAVPAALYAKDAAGRYLLVNKRAADIIGHAPEDIIGKTDLELLEADSHALQWADERAMENGGQEIETRVGSRIIQDVKVPFHAEDGSIDGVIGISLDVTERRVVEREIEEARRMNALGQLARGIIHDFNHVMGIVRGHVEFIRSDTAPEQGQSERRGYRRLSQDLDAIETAVKEGEALVDALMSFARAGSHEIREQSLTEVVNDLAGMLHFPGIKMRLRLSDAPERMLGNNGQLRQVVMNLVLNARDAMPDGGTMTITTFVTNTHVGLSVQDTGAGIPATEQGEIFEPFYTTKAKGQTTGLGLAIVYGIVQEARGDIRVKSAEGEGTLATVTFPRVT